MLWNPDHRKVNGDLLLRKSNFFLERWPGLYKNESLRDRHESRDRSLPVHHKNWDQAN